MSVTASPRKAGPYACDGSDVTFTFAFKVFKAADVRVVHTDASGVETDLTLTTDYTVSLNADQDTSPGGSITTVATYPLGETITLTSKVAEEQPVVITNMGGFYPQVINNALDRLTILVQQVMEQVGRAVKVNISSSTDPDALIAGVISSAASASASASAASASATTASGHADDAEAAKLAAEAAAAGVDLPSITSGDVGKMLIASASAAWQLVEASLTATSGSIARRATGGRVAVGTPTDAADAVTKAYADGLVSSSNPPASGYTKTVARYTRDEVTLPGDALDFGSISEGVTVTVGPTGSGADVIWAVLDDLPSDASTVTLLYSIGGADTAAGVYFTSLFLSGLAAHYPTEHMCSLYAPASGSPVRNPLTPADVVLDAGNIFRLKWTSTFDSPQLGVYLAGFGV